MSQESAHRNEIDRREFLRVSALVSAGALFSPSVLSALEAPTTKRSWAALHSLLPGKIRPQGWLKTYLEKQATQLAYSLPHVSEPFTGNYWTGAEFDPAEKTADPWWPWEQKAYWVDGALRCALVSGDEKLLDEARAVVDYTLAHATPSGYLGPASFREPGSDFHRWPHAVFFRALSAYSDAFAKKSVVEAMRKHYLSDDPNNYGVPFRNVINVESMLWCYDRTGDRRLLALAENSWLEFLKHAGEDGHGDLAPERVLADTAIKSHGVTYAETSKLPAILYNYTGKTDYLKFALAAQQRIFDRYMLVDGIPSTSESYSSITSRDVHETCDIADHTWSWGYLLETTGDGVWADRIERACFNAGLGAIKKDWKGVQYFSCPNQMLATPTSSHIPNSGPMMAYHPNPGEHTACCGGNVHRIFPNYALRMWMRDSQGGLAATLYGACEVKTGVGPHEQPVVIVETTNYPFDETIHFKIDSAKPISFSLALRIPGWCKAPRLQINNHAASLPRIEKGFAVVQRAFKPGDTLTLTLPMETSLSRWPDHGVAFERGPLVYSLPIKEAWSSVVVPRYSTADFPVWIANPSAPWNFGAALKTVADAKFDRRTMTAEPWLDPPVRLTIPARKVEGWDLAVDPNDSEARFSPPIPDLASSEEAAATSPNSTVPTRDFLPAHFQPGPVRLASQIERIELVPYGATHLRVTVFPETP